MGLDAVIRSAYRIADRVTASLQTTVRHERWTSVDGYGTATYARRVERPAIVVQKTKRFTSVTGEELTATTQIVFLAPVTDLSTPVTGRQGPTDPRDRITLANDRVVRIVSVEGLEDPSTERPYAEVVWVA